VFFAINFIVINMFNLCAQLGKFDKTSTCHFFVFRALFRVVVFLFLVGSDFGFLDTATAFDTDLGFGFALTVTVFFVVVLLGLVRVEAVVPVAAFFCFLVSDVDESAGAGLFLDLVAGEEVVAVDFLGVGAFCNLTVFFVVLLALWVLSLLTGHFFVLAIGRRAPATRLAAGNAEKPTGAVDKD